MSKTIKELQHEIHEVAKEKGFWEKERNMGELLMLTVTELSEAMEAHRAGKFANTSIVLKHEELKDEVYFKNRIKDTFEDEIADAVIRLLDLCTGFGINIEWHIIMKNNYNKTRPKYNGKKY